MTGWRQDLMNSFFKLEYLSRLHIELTNACNAACPMCVRFYRNSPLIRPDLEISQITLEKFVKYLPPHVISKVVRILLCGTSGDPGMAKDLYEICEYISNNSEATVILHTNGGMRKPEFWAKLGGLFANNAGKDWRIIFNIDGLEDTNHIYRRNVDWNTLMANVDAFIGAGGQAYWEFLIFKHNEHQIRNALVLSKQKGFKKFNTKRALGVSDNKNLTSMHVLDREGNLEYKIYPPENPSYRNLKEPEQPEVIEKEVVGFNKSTYDFLRRSNNLYLKEFNQKVTNAYDILASKDNTQLDSHVVNCKSYVSKEEREFFIDCYGKLLPCCFVGTHINSRHDTPDVLQLHHEMNKAGLDQFSLDHYSIEEILTSGRMDKLFTDSWSKPTCSQGKMAFCASTCGQNSEVDRIR